MKGFNFEIGETVFIKVLGEVTDASGREVFELSYHPTYYGIIEEREVRLDYSTTMPAYLVAFNDQDGRPLTDAWMLENDLYPVAK